MGDIQQIYCTHCTHGSSVLERCEGELAHRTLGYSARAGSLDATQLRKYYRQIERYVYYYLPRDTPGEEKLSQTAATAPRRLLFFPAGDELQIAGQVCYRPTDSEGRPGSYFAHVLFRAEDDSSTWSGLDCLRLWQAQGWVQEDSPHHPFRLPKLSSLDDLRGGRRPAIDDDVLKSFLMVPAQGTFDDPAHVIPKRWRQKDPAERRALLADALDTLLEIGAAQYDRLLLVAEPQFASLIFYGMLRLLPQGSVADKVSFSTFEPNPDRLCTMLAATTFHDPAVNELRAEAYRSGGVVMNTYTGRRSDRRRPPGMYASHVVARFVELGWPSVDRMLAHMRGCGARDSASLESLAVADRLLPALLTSQVPTDRAWRQWPMAVEYVRRVLVQDLGTLSVGDVRLQALAGMPVQRLILEFAAGEGGAVRPAIAFLLGALPLDWVGEIATYPSVSLADKTELLARHVAQRGNLPAGSDWIWDQADKALNGQAKPGESLLIHILGQLEGQSLERFYHNTASSHADTFLPALVETCKLKLSRWESLTHLLKKVDDTALLMVYHRRGASFFARYPDNEPALPERLRRMVRTLTAHPMSFAPRLEVVLAAQDNLGDEDERQRALAWNRCRTAIHEVGRLARERVGIWRRRPIAELEMACLTMADSAASAIPAEDFPHDRTGAERERFLLQLGTWVVRGEPLFPSDCREQKVLMEKVRARFIQGTWPKTPLVMMMAEDRKRRFGRWFWMATGMGVGLSLALMAILVQSRWEKGKSPNRATPASSVPKSESPRRQPDPPPPAVDPNILQPTDPSERSPLPSSPANRDLGQSPPSPSPPAPTAAKPPAPPDIVSQPPPVAKPLPAPAIEQASDGTFLLRGDFRVHPQPKATPNDNSPVRVTLWVMDADGRKMTPSDDPRGLCIIQCTLVEKHADGTDQQRGARGGRDGFDPIFLGTGVERMLARFRFYRLPGPLGGGAGPLVAATPWYTIDIAGRSSEYRVTLTLSEAEMQLLQRILSGSAPRHL